MDGKIIAISGSHGTGKTTAAYALAAELKRSQAGEVGVVCEVARRCPLPVYRIGHNATTRQAQLWVFVEQVRAEIEAVQRYEWVVSDRTIVDSIAYSSVAGFHDLAFGQLSLARHHVSIYERVIFHGAADNPYCTDDGFRDQDLTLRCEVERRLLELYAELGVEVERRRV